MRKEQTQITPPTITNISKNLETLKEDFILPKEDKKILNTLEKQVKNNEYNTTLNQETGIPELEKLYWDDYDFTTGKYKGMLPETKKIGVFGAVQKLFRNSRTSLWYWAENISQLCQNLFKNHVLMLTSASLGKERKQL